MKRKLIAILFILSLIPGLFVRVRAGVRENYAADRVSSPAGGILLYLEDVSKTDTLQEMADEYLASQAGKGAEWFAIALKQYHRGIDFKKYTEALLKLPEEKKNATATQKQLLSLTLLFMDQRDNPYIRETLESTIGENGLMSYVYGLHLLNNGAESSKYQKETLIKFLLSERKQDGGWSLMGDHSDVDVTSMTLQALSSCKDEDPEVKEALDTALLWLSEKQLESGGYSGFGSENAESTAQVITALSALGIDPERDERFIKNGHTLVDALLQFQLPDGSFSHVKGGAFNMTATTQAFYALVSLWRVQRDLGPLFIYDEKEAYPEDNSEPERNTVSPSLNPDEPEKDSPEKGSDSEGLLSGYKKYALIGILALTLISCLIQILRKKRRFKNYLSILILAVLSILLVFFTDIKSRDSYYNGDDKAKADITGTVTLTIRCDTIVGKADSPYIPDDGVILKTTEFDIEEGDTVFDVLMEAARKYEIQVENKGGVMSAHGMSFISGINYLYEFDFGDLSGWVYHVNDISPSVGCGEYVLKDGDVIEWLYTCDLGNDVQ